MIAVRRLERSPYGRAVTALPRPAWNRRPAGNPVETVKRQLIGIVRRGAHVVCVHTVATTPAGGNQFSRPGVNRPQRHHEGRCSTTEAWSSNAKPRRWKRRGFRIPSGNGRGQFRSHELSTPAPNGMQPENAIFRTALFLPQPEQGMERNGTVRQRLPEALGSSAAAHRLLDVEARDLERRLDAQAFLQRPNHPAGLSGALPTPRAMPAGPGPVRVAAAAGRRVNVRRHVVDFRTPRASRPTGRWPLTWAHPCRQAPGPVRQALHAACAHAPAARAAGGDPAVRPRTARHSRQHEEGRCLTRTA